MCLGFNEVFHAKHLHMVAVEASAWPLYGLSGEVALHGQSDFVDFHGFMVVKLQGEQPLGDFILVR